MKRKNGELYENYKEEEKECKKPVFKKRRMILRSSNKSKYFNNNDNKNNNNKNDEKKKIKKVKKLKIKTKVSPTNDEDPDIEDLSRRFESQYLSIKKQRSTLGDAPVDTQGAGKCHEMNISKKNQRFQILVALLLSSQTRDQITYNAMKNLQKHYRLFFQKKNKKTTIIKKPTTKINWDEEKEENKKQNIEKEKEKEKEGIKKELKEDENLQNFLNSPQTTTSVIEKIIYPVGFYKRKSSYLKKLTTKLFKDSKTTTPDIPNTLKGLIALPGIGPKMAFLILRHAWSKVEGIGVDSHVFTISKRVGWVNNKATNPEKCRIQLQKIVPKKYWGEINEQLVGFGQLFCKPKKPNCDICLINKTCLYNLNQKNGKKLLKKVKRIKKRKRKKNDEDEDCKMNDKDNYVEKNKKNIVNKRKKRRYN